MILLSNSPVTTAAHNQLELNLVNSKRLLKEVTEALKKEGIKLLVYTSEIDEINNEIVKVTITRGFSSLVDKEETLIGYKNRLIGIFDLELVNTKRIVPIYKIKDYRSINPVRKSFFAVRSFICTVEGSIRI